MAKVPFGDDYEYRIVDNRAVGKDIQFSVALSKAIEGHLVKENIEYDAVFMNARTLFRAFHGSFNNDVRPPKAKLIEGFLEEISFLKPFIEQLGYEIFIYYPTYTNPTKAFPDANVQQATSPNQRIYADHELAACEVLGKEGLIDQICNYVIQGHSGKTVMVTHYPTDLLSLYNFGDLTLLETNSGALKEKSEWNTKLGAPSDIAPRLPFNILTLQVFGDKAKLFKSAKEKKARDILLKLAIDKKWTPYTTKVKVQSDIKDLEKLEKDFADRFNRMLSVKLK